MAVVSEIRATLTIDDNSLRLSCLRILHLDLFHPVSVDHLVDLILELANVNALVFAMKVLDPLKPVVELCEFVDSFGCWGG